MKQTRTNLGATKTKGGMKNFIWIYNSENYHCCNYNFCYQHLYFSLRPPFVSGSCSSFPQLGFALTNRQKDKKLSVLVFGLGTPLVVIWFIFAAHIWSNCLLALLMPFYWFCHIFNRIGKLAFPLSLGNLFQSQTWVKSMISLYCASIQWWF